jgi:hypothetical protein
VINPLRQDAADYQLELQAAQGVVLLFDNFFALIV